MGSDTNDEGGPPADQRDALDVSAISVAYKVFGTLSDSNGGVGVLGRNTATSGPTKGVEGRVDSPEGYGLYTPDDAGVGGVLTVTDAETGSDDFTLQTGTTGIGAARNVILGHENNTVADGATGSAIGGGGFGDGTIDDSNRAFDHYATLGGGRNNQAGSDDGDATSAEYATVGGGHDNTANGPRSTVGGGLSNTASDFNATVAGGRDNTASAGATTVGGGNGNTATGRRGTVAGGINNLASGDKSFVGGGDTNAAGNVNAVVPGGFENTASGRASVVLGGAGNEASGRRSTIPGGAGNTAAGEYSLAAGRFAEAYHQGSFVWSGDASTSFSSTGSEQFLVEAPGGVGLGTTAPTTQLDVDGAVSASKVGVSAYRSQNQTINHDDRTRVVFDAERADHFSGLDTSDGVYTVQVAGDYHVDFLIDWESSPGFDEGSLIEYRLLIDGTTTRGLDAEINVGSPLNAAHCFSKTVFGLTAGDTIEVVVHHVSGGAQEIDGGTDGPTYLTIHKVG